MAKDKTQHYFSAQLTSDYHEQSFSASLRKTLFTFYTASGVFSIKKIDKGSELLINNAVITERAKTLLDLGCGYGPVGVVLGKCFPKKEILMTDVNERAILLAKKNIAKNKVENAKVRTSDGFTNIKEYFDIILLNPPQTAGKKLCLHLIEESYKHLNKDGTLQIVARHQKGGKSLSQHMKNFFGNLEEVAKGSGYRIYLSVKV